MMAYMTDLATVEVREERTFAAEGHDLKSLLYNFLDKCLYVFCTELLVCNQIEVESLELVSSRDDAGDGHLALSRRRGSEDGDDSPTPPPQGGAADGQQQQVWRIRARGVGERFGMGRHPQGTEVKAITYSNMQVFDRQALASTPQPSPRAWSAPEPQEQGAVAAGIMDDRDDAMGGSRAAPSDAAAEIYVSLISDFTSRWDEFEPLFM